jgi:hypothetical protein
MNLKRMWHGGNSRNHGRFSEGTLHERRTLASLSGPGLTDQQGNRMWLSGFTIWGWKRGAFPATASPQYRWLVLAPFI